MRDILDILAPKPCPVPLLRVGGEHDGAYLVPDDLDGIEACFSPGVSTKKHFEDDLVNTFGIKCHLCDQSTDISRLESPLIAGMQTFDKKWLEPVSSDTAWSLEQWVRHYCPNDHSDLLLQMDIEGAEYRNLLACTPDLINRFRVIAIGLHGLGALATNTVGCPVRKLLEQLAETHVCVHSHPNNCCGDFLHSPTGINIPHVIELTYLRRDRFKSSSEAWIAPKLPHPNDIAYNVRKNPPLHLNEYWLPFKGNEMESVVKKLRDSNDYLHYVVSEHQQKRMAIAAENARTNDISRSAVVNLYREMNAIIEKLGQSAERPLVDIAPGSRYFISSRRNQSSGQDRICESGLVGIETARLRDQWLTVVVTGGQPLEMFQLEPGETKEGIACCPLYWALHNELSIPLESFYPVCLPGPNGCNTSPMTPVFGKSGKYLTLFSPANAVLSVRRLNIYVRKVD